MIRKIVAAVILCVALIPVQTASAHVLLKDSASGKGAVLHILPDDDPVAGEKTTIWLTLDGIQNKGTKASLEVRGVGVEPKTVPVTLQGTIAATELVFPAQGSYELQYTVKTLATTYTFVQSQAVTRGVVGTTTDVKYYSWAEALLLAGIVLLATTATIAFKYRREILKQSHT